MTLDNNLLKKIENFKRHILKSIPLPSTNTPSTDDTNGSTGSSLEYARSDHQHPKSTLYAESVHTHNDILSDLMDDINNTTIVVDSPNPIGQDGDTILLRGRMYGDDVIGKSIDYYIGNTLIGSSVTNGNGVSFLDYECDGLGVRNVTAKNGSVVSEIYEVLDCVAFDKALDGTGNHNDEMWNYTSSRISLVRGTDGTTVTNNYTGYDYLNTNKSGTPSTQYDWDTPLCFEFDYERLTTNANSRIQIFDTDNQSFTAWINTDGHFKVVVDENIIRYFINGVEQPSKTVTMGTFLFRFYMQSNASFKFSNFKIYPI